MFVVLPLLLLAGTPSRSAGLAQLAPARVIEINAERFQFWPRGLSSAKAKRSNCGCGVMTRFMASAL